MFEAYVEKEAGRTDGEKRNRVTVFPFQFGHGLEIHPPYAGEGGRNGKDTGPGCQLFVDFTFLDGHHGEIDLNSRADGVADRVEGSIDASQMVKDIAEIISAFDAYRGPPTAEKLAGSVHQWPDGMLEQRDLPLQIIEQLDVGSSGASGKNLLFDFLEL